MDFYAASGMSLLWCVWFQTFAIVWCFGGDKLYNCLEQMLGFKICRGWVYCWKFVSPAFMGFLFLFYFIKYTPIKYAKTYEYPAWGEVLGFMISCSSMIWVPAYALYFLIKTPGSLRERWAFGITPQINMRPDATISEYSKDKALKAAAAATAAKGEVELRLTENEDKSNHI